MKKKMMISTAIGDLRALTEETLAEYESVSIEAAVLILNDEIQELLNRKQAKVSAAKILNIPGNTKLLQKNGKFVMDEKTAAEQRPEEKIYLFVNGKLEIHKGCEEGLKQYVKIFVNGKVSYPESLAGSLRGILEVNGKEEAYPDDAVYVEGELAVDRILTLRAREGSRYFVSRKANLTDEKTDPSPLVKKGVQIHAEGGAVVAEKWLEPAVELLDETTKIKVIEEGFAYVDESSDLDESFWHKYGRKVSVDGDLKVTDQQALEQMEALTVTGTVKITEELKGAFLERCREFGKLFLIRGKLIDGEVDVRIDAEALAETEMLQIHDCVNVVLADTITPEMVSAKLEFTDCVNISCREALLGVVRLAAKDCVSVGLAEEEEAKRDEDTVYVECASYGM